MPRKKWINKNNPDTQTFQLLYRSQDDPLLNDEAAGDRALFPVQRRIPGSSSQKQSRSEGLHLADLEDDLDFESMRDNEGEAAEYGIFYDDTTYDYMQHLREIGRGAGDSHFIDAVPTKIKGKDKEKPMRLEDALAQIHLRDEELSAPSLVDGGISTFSRSNKDRRIEAQQDVPDEIAGFQPDMDPRLREALEALEDDAYIDEKDEDDVFGALGLDGKDNGELDIDDFEGRFEDEDGWESDATEKPSEERPRLTFPVANTPDGIAADNAVSFSNLSTDHAAAVAAEDGDWLRDFAKYKRDTATKAPLPAAGSIAAASGLDDKPASLYTLNGTPLRQKRRKGAMTNPSAYSMTSSSLARTEGQQLLDARFDQVEKMYALDEADEFDDMDGGASLVSGMTGASKMSKMSALSSTSFADPKAVRSDFNGMMDDFLGDWDKANPGGGKRRGAKGKRGKNGNEVYGLQQLDELRSELGPARVNRKVQKT